MPLIRIEILKGKDASYKKTLLDAVHDALAAGVQGLHLEALRLYELEPECFERAPGKTDHFTMIEITMFPGRTKAQKARIFEEITKELYTRLGINNGDVFIVIQEPPNENWGLAGKQRE